MMSRYKIVTVLLAILALLSGCSKEYSTLKIDFNKDWKFLLIEDDGSEKGMELSDFDDSEWTNVRLPHTANIEPLVVNDQWQGYCWYRKSFNVPASMSDKKIVLELEGAMNISEVWVNGEKVTKHYGGFLPVVEDVTEYLKFGKDNVFAIRLDNTDSKITGPKPYRILDFSMYGGLYRNAWLKVQHKVHISDPILAKKEAGGGIFITTPVANEKESLVKVKTNIVNETNKAKTIELIQSVYYKNELVSQKKLEKETIKAGSEINPVTELKVKDAKLWSPTEPNLYHLVTKVLVEGKSVDIRKTRFGIREFRFEGHDLYINGKKTYLRGTNRHQEYPYVGYAMSDNAQYRDAKKIKEGGFDFIRLSHYPHSNAFMDACDELGLVVIDAIMGWQFYQDTDEFRNYCYNSARNLIRRDRNHPCVLTWEVSLNETRMPIFFMEELHRITHAEFPGDNVYSCGWKPEVYDIYLQARQHRILHPIELPDKPYMVSEYGDWEYYSNNAGLNQHLLSRDKRYETSSRQAREYGEARLLQQAYNVQEAHNDNYNTVAFGDGYWVMYDYNRGTDDNIEYSGVMDIFRLPKFGYYFYQSQRNVKEKIVLEIGTFWTPKSPLDVKVFSNCDQVELFLNGKSLGKQDPDSGINTENLQHPPFAFNIEVYKAGELKAIGYLNEKKVAEQIVLSPEKAVKLKVWVDESGKAPEAGCNDVVFVYVAAVDKNGTIVPDFVDEIDCSINGDAEIMNLDGVKAEAGIATVVLQIGETSGDIQLEAITDNLESGAFTINVK